MWEYLKNPETLFAIITAIIAIFALFQTGKQIKLSNKQHLFDRRLEKYMIIKDLFTLFSEHRIHIVEKKELMKDLTLEFHMLTNVKYLYDMNFVLKDIHNSKKVNMFLSKCEMLEKYALEIGVLWNDEIGDTFSLFVRVYKEMLFKMYQQQIFIEGYKEFNEEQNVMITGKKLDNALSETANNLGLFQTLQKLDSIYNKIIDEELEQKLIKSLKL